MPVSTNCPACGAQISVSDAGGQVVCPYCGNRFEVNMDNTQPEFKLAGNTVEPGVEPTGTEPVTPDLTQEPSALSTQVDSSYSQSAEQVEPQIYTTISQASNFPWRRYGLIGIAVLTGVFCLACLCMVVIIQRVIK